VPQSRKARRKALKNIPAKSVPVASLSISNVPAGQPASATTNPYEEDQVIENFRWGRQEDRTHGPDIEASETVDATVSTSDQFASSWPALIDKYVASNVLFNKNNIIVIIVFVWVIFGAVLMYRDNAAGKIDNLSGLQWLGVKFGIVSVLFLVLILIILLFFQTSSTNRNQK
jgi:hypothetical protein